jgi:hypothetical protein
MVLNTLSKTAINATFGFLLTIGSVQCFAQGTVYSVGQNNTLMYTNLPSYKDTATVTYSVRSEQFAPKERSVMPTTTSSTSTRVSSKPAPITPAWGEAIRINPKDQAQRDQGRRQILESELANTQRALSEAQNTRDEAKVARLQSDLAALRYEMSLVR